KLDSPFGLGKIAAGGLPDTTPVPIIHGILLAATCKLPGTPQLEALAILAWRSPRPTAGHAGTTGNQKRHNHVTAPHAIFYLASTIADFRQRCLRRSYRPYRASARSTRARSKL